MAIVIQDSMANNSPDLMQSRTPEVGGPWIKRGADDAYTSDWDTGAPVAYAMTNGGAASPWYSVTMAPAADTKLSFLCRIRGFETFIILARLQPGGTKSGYGIKMSGTNVSIIRYDADVETVLGTASGGAVGGHTYQIEVIGTTINANRDGALVITRTDANYASGTLGFEFKFGFSAEFWEDALGETAAIVPPNSPTLLTASCAAPTGEPLLSDAPTTAFTADVRSGIAPLTVNFTDASGNTPTSWLWNFGDGSTATSQNPTHIFVNEGAYVVSLTATNATGSREYVMVIYVTSSVVVVLPGDDAIIPADVNTTFGRIAFYTVDSDNNIVKGVSSVGAVVLSFGSLGVGNGQFFRPTTCSVVNGRQRLDRIEIIEE